MQQKHYIFIGILVLAFLAGNFVFPVFYDKATDVFNNKFSQNLPHFWSLPFRLGLDLQGGVSLTYQADLSNIGGIDAKEAMAGLRDVIERRVNTFGVAEPVVQVQGENRLVVELPGVANVQEAKKMIGETPFLEFLEQRTEEEANKILDKMKEVQEAQGKGEDISKIEDWQLAMQNPYFKPTELTGQYLKSAQVTFDQTTYRPQIDLQFNDEGAKKFEDITGRNIGKGLAIYLDGFSIIDTNGDRQIDGNDIYAPTVQDKITGGSAVITGEMSVQKANEIVRRLNSGALPVKIGQPIFERAVGPVLGQIALAESLWAGILGFALILLFMMIFYRMPGFVASLSLMLYIVLMLSLVKLIPITLTLAGIAGFLLSMGMAVDANILIFSRMREELKSGKGYILSLEEGVKRAWPSIRDGNFTTILVGIILFAFGTSFVKGFAFTLVVGNLMGMFTAIVATNNLLKIFLRGKDPKWLWLWK